MNFLLANTLRGYAIRVLVGNPLEPAMITEGSMNTELGFEPPGSLGGIPV
jgi:hypothetical protein